MNELEKVAENMDVVEEDECPVCGAKLEFSGGCQRCIACGWAKCG